MNEMMRLSEISPGQSARVAQLLTKGSMRRRFLDIGLVEHTPVTCLGKSPMGDPMAFLIRGAVIAIRKEDCRNIFVFPLSNIG